jgi:RNA polymerase primary sigma factor
LGKVQDKSSELYFNEINRIELITREEEIKLAKRIIKGDIEAKKRLVEANLKLVAKIANEYEIKGDLSSSDLIQEGNLGLIKAAEKFNPTKGYKFVTYAAFWIRSHIIHAIKDKGGTIHIPLSTYEDVKKLKKAKSKLFNKLERAPTHDEIEHKFLAFGQKTQLDMSVIESILAITHISINSRMKKENGENGKIFEEVIPDDKNPTEDELAEKFDKKLAPELM